MRCEHTKELRYGLSRSGWIITAMIFLINIPRIILMSPTMSQDPFMFVLDIGAGFVGAYLGVRILSEVWGFVKGIVGKKNDGGTMTCQ